MGSVDISAADTACKGAMAQVGVGDNSLTAYCGCAEGSNIHVTPDSPSLTCTVAAGTTIYFSYAEATQEHQIISTGAPNFASSPISRPRKHNHRSIWIHAVGFDTAGTYSFSDTYFPSLTGQIVVTP